MEETGLPGLKPISVVDRCSYFAKGAAGLSWL